VVDLHSFAGIVFYPCGHNDSVHCKSAEYAACVAVEANKEIDRLKKKITYPLKRFAI